MPADQRTKRGRVQTSAACVGMNGLCPPSKGQFTPVIPLLPEKRRQFRIRSYKRKTNFTNPCGTSAVDVCKRSTTPLGTSSHPYPASLVGPNDFQNIFCPLYLDQRCLRPCACQHVGMFLFLEAFFILLNWQQVRRGCFHHRSV